MKVAQKNVYAAVAAFNLSVTACGGATSPKILNLTHKISNEIDTVEDKKQLNEPLPNDL